MARFTITYDGTSLQTANIKSDTIKHESIDNKRQDIQLLGRSDGGKLVSINYSPKAITIVGSIKGSSQADLEQRIESLKELISRQQKNLDIGYAGGTRRFVTTMSSFTMERMHYNLTYAEWEMVFIVSNPPFGRALDTTTANYSIGTAGTYDGTITFVGNAPPLPKIKVTVVSQSNMSALVFRNKETGDYITIRRTFANSDIVIIDTLENTVTVNGTAVDYEGFFPEFKATSNDFAVTPIGSNATLTLKIIYYPFYL